MQPVETPDQEMGRIWKEMERLRKELSQGPDTIENYLRGQEISNRLAKLEARYKELAGPLYHGSRYQDDQDDD